MSLLHAAALCRHDDDHGSCSLQHTTIGTAEEQLTSALFFFLHPHRKKKANNKQQEEEKKTKRPPHTHNKHTTVHTRVPQENGAKVSEAVFRFCAKKKNVYFFWSGD